MKLIANDGNVYEVVQLNDAKYMNNEKEPDKNFPHTVNESGQVIYQSARLDGKWYGFRRLK